MLPEGFGATGAGTGGEGECRPRRYHHGDGVYEEFCIWSDGSVSRDNEGNQEFICLKGG